MRPLVVVGPTAAGKTGLALELARRAGGEMVSLDSRQVYRGLNAGTAAPAGAWQDGVFVSEGVPCHLVDFLDPRESLSAVAFAAAAREAAAGIRARGRVPVFCGGTGLYLEALYLPLDDLPASDPAVRTRLERELARDGVHALYARLRRLDAAAAERTPPTNRQRITRYLEVIEMTGRPISEQWSGAPRDRLPEDRAVFVAPRWEPAALRARIRERAAGMFDPMLEEARVLRAAGVPEDAPGFQSLGYPEILAHLRGELTRDAAFEALIVKTGQYAKRQRTWFNRYKNLRWLTPGADGGFDVEEVLAWARA